MFSKVRSRTICAKDCLVEVRKAILLFISERREVALASFLLCLKCYYVGTRSNLQQSADISVLWDIIAENAISLVCPYILQLWLVQSYHEQKFSDRR